MSAKGVRIIRGTADQALMAIACLTCTRVFPKSEKIFKISANNKKIKIPIPVPQIRKYAGFQITFIIHSLSAGVKKINDNK